MNILYRFSVSFPAKLVEDMDKLTKDMNSKSNSLFFVKLDANSLSSLFMDLPEYFIKFTFYVENKELVIEWLNTNSPTTRYKCESWYGIQKQEKE